MESTMIQRPARRNFFYCERWDAQMGIMCKIQCAECNQAELDDLPEENDTATFNGEIPSSAPTRREVLGPDDSRSSVSPPNAAPQSGDGRNGNAEQSATAIQV